MSKSAGLTTFLISSCRSMPALSTTSWSCTSQSFTIRGFATLEEETSGRNTPLSPQRQVAQPVTARTRSPRSLRVDQPLIRKRISSPADDRLDQKTRKAKANPDAAILVNKLQTANARIRLLETSQKPLFHEDGTTNFDPIFLRDACNCDQCVDPSTRQRNFSTADIPTSIVAKPIGKEPDGTWKVTWVNDIPGLESSHVSTFPPSFVKDSTVPGSEILSKTSLAYAKLGRPLWDKKSFEDAGCWTDYEAYMNEESTLRTTLSSLRHAGLVFITNVPEDSSSVSNIATRIGPLRDTFYGPTWDVRSIADAKNVAYTDKNLGFHMDLLYMQNPPAYQLLHCLRNSCSGGESRFVDTFKAASILEQHHPKKALALRRLKLRYHYANDCHYYSEYRSVLQGAIPSQMGGNHWRNLDEKFDPPGTVPIDHVNWSPPFQAGIESWQRKNASTVEALKTFADILEREDLVFQTKLGEGTCAIFENRRVAHARNAFQMKSGIRWLRGAYFDEDAFWSKLRAVGAVGE